MRTSKRGRGRSSMLIGEDRAGNAVGVDPHKRTLTAIVVDARGPSLTQLTVDPAMTPAWVLACEPEHEFPDLGREPRSAGPAAVLAPRAADKRPVAAKQSPRGDQQQWFR
jgi:hypothetical protein